MCIKNKIKFLGLIIFFFFISWYAMSETYEASISDLDGTWILSPKLSKGTYVVEMEFSWGIGKSIGESSLEVDLKRKFFFIPGGGAWIVEKVSKINTSDVQIVVFNNDIPYVEFPANKKPRITLRFSFVNHDKFKITSQVYNIDLGDSDPYLDNNSIWYRLSGPVKK